MKIGACDYCSNNFEKSLDSEWGDRDEQHYKSTSCDNCGKKNWLKVDFQGSGHDDSIEEDSIDSVVRKVREG
jgi:hypothetical protein